MVGDEKPWWESAWDSVSGLWGGNKKVVAETTVYRADGRVSEYEVRQECPSDWSQAAEIDRKVVKAVRAQIHQDRVGDEHKAGDENPINAGMEIYVVPQAERGPTARLISSEVASETSVSLGEVLSASSPEQRAKLKEKHANGRMFRVYLPSGAPIEDTIEDMGPKGLITEMRESTEKDVKADLQRVEEGRKKLGSLLNKKEWTMREFVEEGLPIIRTFIDPDEALQAAADKLAKTTGAQADLLKLKLAEELAKTRPSEVAVIVSEVTPIAQACGHSQPVSEPESKKIR